jgi:hypothetical protein
MLNFVDSNFWNVHDGQKLWRFWVCIPVVSDLRLGSLDAQARVHQGRPICAPPVFRAFENIFIILIVSCGSGAPKQLLVDLFFWDVNRISLWFTVFGSWYGVAWGIVVRLNHVFYVVVEVELAWRSGRCYWHGPCGLGCCDCWFWGVSWW